ncbi:glycosyltransferase family 2 protein [Luteibaculum oceani]|uniref:Glycosyltransferase family 2 protein n=1 Tax=Luteibaculum oceani TaxID=1294296 RepID=A0A5C6VAA4_9FLAO|nr:glycosyltransferase family 2 protein [Luteibaculum oceani]TXC81411.1 glycosyltransferase family 2 protein [Luteibaculum oceani]
MEKLKVSVIIPTRNRAELLRGTLESIARQSLDKQFYEVIVCDNDSKDNTKSICEEYKSSFSYFKYIYTDKIGLHVGRHAGLMNSKGDYLVFADDDIEAFSRWLETIYNEFENDSNIGLIGGKNLPKFLGEVPFWIHEKWNQPNADGRVLSELSLLDLGESKKYISPNLVFGCNYSIRKKILLETEGFHPDGFPFELIKYRGDGESYVSNYVKKSDYKCLYHPMASVWHLVTKDRLSKNYFFKRSYCQGVSDAYTKLRSENKISKDSFLQSLIKPIKKVVHFLRIGSLTDMDKQLLKSYNEGYKYLVHQYATNVEVRNWVRKSNYLE